MIRRLLICLAWRAAQNPHVQKQAGKIAGQAVEKARPALLKGARRAGELTRAARDEIAYQTQKGRKNNDK